MSIFVLPVLPVVLMHRAKGYPSREARKRWFVEGVAAGVSAILTRWKSLVRIQCRPLSLRQRLEANALANLLRLRIRCQGSPLLLWRPGGCAFQSKELLLDGTSAQAVLP